MSDIYKDANIKTINKFLKAGYILTRNVFIKNELEKISLFAVDQKYHILIKSKFNNLFNKNESVKNIYLTVDNSREIKNSPGLSRYFLPDRLELEQDFDKKKFHIETKIPILISKSITNKETNEYISATLSINYYSDTGLSYSIQYLDNTTDKNKAIIEFQNILFAENNI